MEVFRRGPETRMVVMILQRGLKKNDVIVVLGQGRKFMRWKIGISEFMSQDRK